jgi:transposase
MKSHTGTRRNFTGLEKRRLKAARLFAQGKSRAEVARALQVSWPAVNNWHAAWQREGEPGLKAAGRAGRNPKLTPAQLAQVEQELLRGPLAHGYVTILWTLPRIADLIAKLTGVKYHPGHVWRILRALDWSLQRPEHRAKERDDEAIMRWQKRRWPQRKRGRSVEALGSCTSTRAASRSGRP